MTNLCPKFRQPKVLGSVFRHDRNNITKTITDTRNIGDPSAACIKITIFNVYGSVHHKNILIYIQQDATLHGLFYLETALQVSGDSSTHHQERKQLYL
jgi:hypothetical protein